MKAYVIPLTRRRFVVIQDDPTLPTDHARQFREPIECKRRRQAERVAHRLNHPAQADTLPAPKGTNP